MMFPTYKEAKKYVENTWLLKGIKLQIVKVKSRGYVIKRYSAESYPQLKLIDYEGD